LINPLPGKPDDAILMGYAQLLEHFELDCPPPRRMTALLPIGHKLTEVR